MDNYNFIDYYERKDRYFRLQEYIDNEVKPKSKITIRDYGFAGSRNGGYQSCFREDSDNYIVYHSILYMEMFNSCIYIDYDAMQMFREVLEKEQIEYTGSDFDFLFMLNEYMKRLPHFPKNLILKRNEKAGKLMKSKAINIAIEYLKHKTRIQ